MEKPRIAVVGAGIIGLQTALFLLENDIDVTIISKSWPGDIDPHYTSTWSGAQWRSNPHPEDIRQREWDRETFLYWEALVKKESPEILGIELKNAVFYWDDLTPAARAPEQHMWWSTFLPTFQRLHPHELQIPSIPSHHQPPFPSFSAGISYKTFAVNPTLHLSYLLSRCKSLGAHLHTLPLTSFHSLFDPTTNPPHLQLLRGVVNCTGLCAGQLAGDDNIFPTNGQTVIVRGSAERIATRAGDGWEALVIPRPGAGVTLLGGCKIEGDWSTTPDPKMTQTILSRCRPMAPELLDSDGNFDVVAVQVGLRPSRRNGPRVEIELVENTPDTSGRGDARGGTGFICHNYGHGSAGFEGGVGAAREAVRLVLEQLGAS